MISAQRQRRIGYSGRRQWRDLMRLIYLVYFAVCGYVVYDLTAAKVDCDEALVQSLRSSHAVSPNMLGDNAKDKCGQFASKGEAASRLVGAGR